MRKTQLIRLHGLSGAVALVNKKRRDVIAYLGMRIIDLYGPERADEFMEEISFDDETRANDNPIAALRKAVAKDEAAPVWRCVIITLRRSPRRSTPGSPGEPLSRVVGC